MLLNGLMEHIHVLKIIYRSDYMTYISYCRKSRLQDPEELARQEQLVRDYCNNKGYKLDKVFAEVGSSISADRPEYVAMMEYLNEHDGVTIVVTDYDRIGRDTLLLSLFKQLCKEHKHLVELVNGTIYSYDNYTDIFTQEILSSVSSYIYQQTKSKMQRGLKQFMECGGKIGATPIGFVRTDKYTYKLDPSKSDTIRQIFTDIIDGLSTKEVADKLEQINFRSSNNKKLGTREVRNIVRNTIYYKNTPQIVSKELWLEANQQLKSLPNKGNKRTYPLSNKIICSHCKTSLIIGYRADRGIPVINGCKSSNSIRKIKSNCDCQGVRYDYIEAIVKSDCLAYIESKLDRLYQKLTDDKAVLAEHQKELDTVQTEIEANKEKLSRLNKLFLLGNVTEQELQEYSREYKDSITLLEEKQKRLESYSLYRVAQELQDKIVRLEKMKDNEDMNKLTKLVEVVMYWKDQSGITVETVFKE